MTRLELSPGAGFRSHHIGLLLLKSSKPVQKTGELSHTLPQSKLSAVVFFSSSALQSGAVFYTVARINKTTGEKMQLSDNAPDPIMVVEDSPSVGAVLTHIVEELGFRAILCATGALAIATYQQQQLSAIIMDVVLPDMTGYDVTRKFRRYAEKNQQRWTPIIFQTSMCGEEHLEEGIEAGGDDFLFKPVSRTVLVAKLRSLLRISRLHDQLTKVNQKLQQLTYQDALTGVYNRRYFDDTLARYIAGSQRQQHPLSALMIDVDHFKAYNDTLGHKEGDNCLILVAKALGSISLRKMDIITRYGGEEFAILLYDTPEKGARFVAERICCAIREANIAHPASPTAPHITVSVGVATAIPEHPESYHGLIHVADEALYDAKHQGRNRTAQRAFTGNIAA